MVKLAAWVLGLSLGLTCGCGEGSGAAGGSCSPVPTAGPFLQGSVHETGVSTDVALLGPGFLVLDGGAFVALYTRDGRLTVDDRGVLVHVGGPAVKAFPAGDAGRDPRTLTLPVMDPPAATTVVGWALNLNSDAAIQRWDATDPEGTSSFTSTVSVYDALGVEHRLQVFFAKVALGAWEWHGMLDGSELAGGTDGTRQVVADGGLTFNTDGTLQAQTRGNAQLRPRGVAGAQDVRFHFGDDRASGGTGLAGASQFASASSATWIGQDGTATGYPSRIDVERLGEVVVSFTNGRARGIGRLALAAFARPEQLTPVATGVYAAATACTGAPSWAPAEGIGTTFVGGALEAPFGQP